MLVVSPHVLVSVRATHRLNWIWQIWTIYGFSPSSSVTRFIFFFLEIRCIRIHLHYNDTPNDEMGIWNDDLLEKQVICITQTLQEFCRNSRIDAPSCPSSLLTMSNYMQIVIEKIHDGIWSLSQQVQEKYFWTVVGHCILVAASVFVTWTIVAPDTVH